MGFDPNTALGALQIGFFVADCANSGEADGFQQLDCRCLELEPSKARYLIAVLLFTMNKFRCRHNCGGSGTEVSYSE